MDYLDAGEFLELSKHNPIIDVRSPGEFLRGHIPGAFNIPLFTNEERAQIGTTYKQIGREPAVLLGLDIVGPKMSNLLKQCQKLNNSETFLIHCWRGGMRSESVSWLLNISGARSSVLSGGYKNYRRHILERFKAPLKLFLITGSTGSGKTEVLHKLQSLGEQVIDLEDLAVHRGSVFGGMGKNNQPSTEQFQNSLFQALDALDPGKRIWLEDESIGIGDVQIPHPFWSQMVRSPSVRIELKKAKRIERLVNEYGLFSREQLEQNIVKITKRLGGLETKTAIEELRKGDLHATADQLLKYYDKAYNNSIERKASRLLCTLNYEHFNLEMIAEDLISAADEQSKEDLIYE